MLAPCMIVLSTSKKAPTALSRGVTRAFSTSAAAAAASPARVDRCWRLSRRGRSGRLTFTTVVRWAFQRPPTQCVGCGRITGMQRTDLSVLVAEAAEAAPDRQALVESEGRILTWSQLEDEVARIATGLGAAGFLAGHRVMIVVGNRIEFVTAYLGALRAQAVAVPV